MDKHNQKECDNFIKKVIEKSCEINKDFNKLSEEDRAFVLESLKKDFWLAAMNFIRMCG